MIFDTHAHCYWDSLLPQIDDVVRRMWSHAITKSTQIGCDIKTSQDAIALAKRFPWVFYATVGLHPETAQDVSCHEWYHELILNMENLIRDNREYIVAVGECGFDFHYLSSDVDMIKSQKLSQEFWFLEQWNLAQKYSLPLVIHTRDARDATLDFMIWNKITRCVMHCFSEDWDFASRLIDFSDEIYFSFSGILTYKKSEKIQEAAKKIPLNKILVETDAPFLAPQVVRGQVNEPAFTRYNLEKIAELRWISVEEIEDVIYQNSLKFYGLQ